MAKMVFPLPVFPSNRVGRFLGMPPFVISSSPWIPVGDLGNVKFFIAVYI
jgi:hypothetical protein